MPAITPDSHCRHPLAPDTTLAINFGLVNSQPRNLSNKIFHIHREIRDSIHRFHIQNVLFKYNVYTYIYTYSKPFNYLENYFFGRNDKKWINRGLISWYETKYEKISPTEYLDRQRETMWCENNSQSTRDAKGNALEMARLPWRS